ncbi:hypothetical protein Taro_024605 [Colocasia esculenta]|uniref:Uncharacterized protein n=1 Tax=Colocasia esculenta TaxID=4460 RepID=A0A843VF01_COLES|nr:hypothetical protein [Colocasia esculenta]
MKDQENIALRRMHTVLTKTGQHSRLEAAQDQPKRFQAWAIPKLPSFRGTSSSGLITQLIKPWFGAPDRAGPIPPNRIGSGRIRCAARPMRPDPFLAGGSSPMRCDPARHCRIGRDPPDTLKKCRRCAAHRDSTVPFLHFSVIFFVYGLDLVVLQMLVVTVVVTVEVEVVMVVRAEEEVRVVREEEVRVVREEEVACQSQRSNFFGVQHKIAVMVPHFGTIEGKGFHLAVKEEWCINISMTIKTTNSLAWRTTTDDVYISLTSYLPQIN